MNGALDISAAALASAVHAGELHAKEGWLRRAVQAWLFASDRRATAHPQAASAMIISARIDFSSPRDVTAPRLRQVFGVPVETLVAYTPDQVRPVLEAVHTRSMQGQWCVGYLRYEAAPAFDPVLVAHPTDGPLAWFGIHDSAHPWPEANESDAEPKPVSVAWREPLSRSAFNSALTELHRAIGGGEVYQVNYTASLQGTLDSGARVQQAQALFEALQRAQPGGYAAYIDAGSEQVLSVSPELFFEWRDGRLLTRPMKGTAARGIDATDDAAAAERLRSSVKERSENVMIVDLLRNDMSRIAEPFSVRVPRLFHTEALSTVWQLTSDVEATTREGTTLADVFAALFPCGSVTGAPKVAAMQLIRRLEFEPRGVYCGAVGVVQPGGVATFNVPIRTVTLSADGARCGIGSGITADARQDGEWEEWRHKRIFLERASTPFELLETLALVDGRLRNVDAHLARMAAAASHFGFRWNAQAVTQGLDTLPASHPEGAWRVRLLCDLRGRHQVQVFALDASPTQVRLALADRAFEAARSEFVRFKTTRRGHYEAFSPSGPDVVDTLLWNESGEITECTRGNVALLLDDRWVTPPLHCGLLGGIGRARLLREGRVVEAVVRLDDLRRVRGLAFFNSLRGWIDAVIEELPCGAATG